MANYGQLIESYEPELDEMYNAFTKYFKNPTMIKTKDVSEYSVYMSKTYCLLSNECRYLLAFTPINNVHIGTPEELLTIKWVSFQTRTLVDNHKLPPHSYNAISQGPLTAVITRQNTGEESSTYSCEDFPITVTLLHTKSTTNAYQDKGTIIAALETYQTIITLNK